MINGSSGSKFKIIFDPAKGENIRYFYIKRVKRVKIDFFISDPLPHSQPGSGSK